MTHINRRLFLETAAGTAALTLGESVVRSADSPTQPADQNTVRDKLWIFTVYAGGDNEGWGLPKPSRMTPAEAAFYLGVPNLLFIRSNDNPPVAQFEQWAIPLRPLKRVLWSLVGSGGTTADDARARALQLAARFPNITGFIMDDFFHKDGSGTLSPAQLGELRKQLVIAGLKRDLYVVLYTHQVKLPVQEHLKFCDKVTFWTWNSKDLKDLEANFERLEKLAPDHGKLLGCYLWDYGAKAPMPLDRMKRQCELALGWLRQKRLEGIILLGNTCCDLELESVEWARQWIAQVGGERL